MMYLQLLITMFDVFSNQKWQPSPSFKLTTSQGLGFFAGEHGTPQQLLPYQQPQPPVKSLSECRIMQQAVNLAHIKKGLAACVLSSGGRVW
jgi:hypothetical protein